MSSFISLTGPHQFRAELVGSHATVWAESKATTVAINISTRAEADALVKAALAARDLLPEPEPCGDVAEHTRETCELPPGHDGWHRSGQIVWPWADQATEHPNPEPEPEPEPAKHCPICGNRLGADGRHVTQSGAHIDAPAVAL